MARFVRLGDRAVLSVSGSDAGGFLQGLITNDVGKPRDGAAIHAALLTPQGKYLFDFLVYRRGDAFRLDCEAEARPALAKRIAMYKLRADVAIDGAIPDTVYAVFGDDAEEAARRIEGADVFPDPRHPVLGWRIVGEFGEDTLKRAGIEDAPGADYEALRIAHGIPDGRRDLVPGKSFLLENGFDELNGVDFEKGCYVGQEVTARMKHRNLVRKRLVPVRIDGALARTRNAGLSGGYRSRRNQEQRRRPGPRPPADRFDRRGRGAARRRGRGPSGEARLGEFLEPVCFGSNRCRSRDAPGSQGTVRTPHPDPLPAGERELARGALPAFPPPACGRGRGRADAVKLSI